MTRVAAALVLLLVAPAARAEEDANTLIAKGHFRKGTDLFKQAKYEEARVEFEAALAGLDLPAFHYNIARCYEHLKRERDAVRAYQVYLERLPGAPDAAEVRERIAELEQRIATGDRLSEPVVQEGRRRRITWVLAAGTLALAIGGAAAIGVAAGNYSSAQQTCNHRCDDATIDGVTTPATVGYVLFAAAGVALAATVVAFLLEGRPPSVAARAARVAFTF